MEKIYVDIHPETGLIRSYGSSPMGENSVEVKAEGLTDHSKFFESFTSYTVDGEGNLLFVLSAEIEQAKSRKIAELGVECEKRIFGKFTVEINGVSYQFSNDMEAQLNFGKLERAFDKGMVAETPWTAYDTGGQVVRIMLTPVTFDLVYFNHLNHVQQNISKFRDVLMPLVAQATTMQEVLNVSWSTE